MIDTKTYEQMRLWENITKMIFDLKRQIASGKIEPDENGFFSSVLETEERTIDDLIKEVNELSDERNTIAKDLSKKGIDVEYIVTSFKNDLAPFSNYSNAAIKRVKPEHRDYKYELYTESNLDKYVVTYDTLDVAIDHIRDLYSWYDNDRVDAGLEDLRKMINDGWK